MRLNRCESTRGGELEPKLEVRGPAKALVDRKTLILVVAASLLALFLGALDALIVGAAMPTIVADLGGLHLYSWVFSSYLLARAISLPIFGKLCDLFSTKKLYLVAIGSFVISSALAGAAQSMTQLILFRALQGVGAGGNFALAYIVVADLSPPDKRGKMMGLISFVWGIASVLGPGLGGFIVTYSSWRWIFYINLPIGSLALLGIFLYLKETREKKRDRSVDVHGALALSILVLTLLTVFMLAGRTFRWFSPEIMALLAITLGAAAAFYHAEKRAKEPVLALDFFRVRGFSTGNGAAFFSSFAIFSLSAFYPLFIQGAMGKSPAQVGLSMIPLSLGWSVGALVCGQLIDAERQKPFSILGAIMLLAATAVSLTFSSSTSLSIVSAALILSGTGMGFISISTLLIVQESLDTRDLGVATSSHQFARTLGGTIGVGASGSLVTTYITGAMDTLMHSPLRDQIPPALSEHLMQSVQSFFQPEVQASLSPDVQQSLQQAIGRGVETVFWASLAVSLVCLALCFLLPGRVGRGAAGWRKEQQARRRDDSMGRWGDE